MTHAGAPVMAKKKAKLEPRGEGWEEKKAILQMRGSSAFKEWLGKLADFDATDVSEVVERSLAAYARSIGFNEPRPKR